MTKMADLANAFETMAFTDQFLSLWRSFKEKKSAEDSIMVSFRVPHEAYAMMEQAMSTDIGRGLYPPGSRSGFLRDATLAWSMMIIKEYGSESLKQQASRTILTLSHKEIEAIKDQYEKQGRALTDLCREIMDNESDHVVVEEQLIKLKQNISDGRYKGGNLKKAERIIEMGEFFLADIT